MRATTVLSRVHYYTHAAVRLAQGLEVEHEFGVLFQKPKLHLRRTLLGLTY